MMFFDQQVDWEPRQSNSESIESLRDRLECSPLLAKLLSRRDFQDPARARSFLEPSESQFHNPYDLAQGEPAASQILSAIRNERTIHLVGENSVDCQLATALLKRLIHQLNGDVNFSIVDRSGDLTELSTELSDKLSIFLGCPPGLEDCLSDNEHQAIVIGRKLSSFVGMDNIIAVDPMGRASRYLNHVISIAGITLKVGEIILRKKYGEEPPNFVAVDLETTGTTASQDEIIEIGAVRFRRGNPVDEFQTFVSSVDNVPEIIEDLTGLKASDLQGAPPPKQALKDFIEFLNEDVLVAHNAPFDAGFLHFSMKKYLGESFLNDYDDTKELARIVLGDIPEHGLKHVCQRLGVDMGTHHRALDDAYSCGEIYVQLRNSNPGPIKNYRRRYLPYVALAALASQTPFSLENHAMNRIGLNCLDRNPFEGLTYLSRRLDEVGGDSFGLSRGPMTVIRLASELDGGEYLVRLLADTKMNGDLMEEMDDLIGRWRSKKYSAVKTIRDEVNKKSDPSNRLTVLEVQNLERTLMEAELAILTDNFDRSFMVVTYLENSMYEGVIRTPETVDLEIILGELDQLTTLGDCGACSAHVTFEMDDVEGFESTMNRTLGEFGTDNYQALYDYELTVDELETISVKELSRIAPHGPGNNRPRFLVRNVSVMDVSAESSTSIDNRVDFEKNGYGFKTIVPEMKVSSQTLSSGETKNIVIEFSQITNNKQAPETKILIVDCWTPEKGSEPDD